MRKTVTRRTFVRTSAVALGAAGMAAARADAEKTVPADAPRVEVASPWQVRVLPGTARLGDVNVPVALPVTLSVAPATLLRVTDEKHDALPLFDPNGAPWAKGAKLRKLATFETTAAGMLVPETFVLKSGPGNAPALVLGKDYALEPQWATVGRLPAGLAEGAPAWADYECGWGRIDSVTVDRTGAVALRQGTPHNATPVPPVPAANEVVIANLWIPGRLPQLTAEHIYPIVEPKYPTPSRNGPPRAAELLPATWSRLQKGEALHVLAWGDSVTAGGQASDLAHRYQDRFVALLKERFPASAIRLTTAGWGGRNSDGFLAEPPGAQFNFEHAVLEPRPNLIVMEFVNDAWMGPDVVEEKYSRLLARFREIGAEWIVLTPHFVRPDWMAAPSVRVEEDPRPYVAGVRRFAAKHRVALADASRRWGHLMKEGIPYITLLSNSINHPDDRGHELFAQALIELFR